MRIVTALGPLTAVALFFVGSTQTAAADVVTMDNFSVTGPAGNNFFNDPFNLTGTLSGPSAVSGVDQTGTTNSITYNVTGSFSESGGTATLNTTNGALLQGSPPFDPLIQQVSASYSGSFLRTGALGATGIFDLGTPTTLGGVYGIEFIDLNMAHSGDTVAMRIIETASGPIIELVNLDHIGSSITVVDSTPLTAQLLQSFNQIELTLSKGTTATGAIMGSYALGLNGSFGTLMTFDDTTSLTADGTTFVTPAFNAFDPVPEPASMVMFASGLAMLGVIRRKRRAT